MVMIVRELLFDQFYHVLYGLSHIHISHAKYLNAVFSEVDGALIIPFKIDRFEMRVAINLYDELDLRTVEIYHIRTNSLLSTKLISELGSL